MRQREDRSMRVGVFVSETWDGASPVDEVRERAVGHQPLDAVKDAVVAVAAEFEAHRCRAPTPAFVEQRQGGHGLSARDSREVRGLLFFGARIENGVGPQAHRRKVG